jgi:6-pyruvoyltetrahydropterin/6-carboxytetrahydropterin synthase
MRQIRFCAGHRLVGHEGRCQNLHGHNYLVELYVTGDVQDAVGRVMDFSVLKSRFKGWLDEHWDHAFLLWDTDHVALRAIRSVQPHRVFELPYNPTAENMARYLLEEVGPGLLADTTARLERVVVWETDESYAEASLTSAPVCG